MDTTPVDPIIDHVISIADLSTDTRNANKGTPRGRAALERSLSQYGAGRSILLDKDNRIIAGNKITQCAGEIGIDKVRIVETDGKEIIAVKRTDLSLDDKNARGLALADNRVGQLDLDWDAEELSRCATDGVVDPVMFTEKEIDEIVDASGPKELNCDKSKDGVDGVEVHVFVIDGMDWVNRKNEICMFFNDKKIVYEVKE
jgi:hypothetical protein